MEKIGDAHAIEIRKQQCIFIQNFLFERRALRWGRGCGVCGHCLGIGM